MSQRMRFDTISIGGNLSIGTTQETILSRNGRRQILVIKNTHATQNLALGLDATVSIADTSTYFKLLAAGEELVLEGYTGPVFGDASGAATTIEAWEGLSENSA